MQDFPYVLSEYEEINSLLYKPINSTQRIKYTCFNVSPNYIILGSTSGSIYLFSRKPCSFLQLIPLSEGAVSRVLISPDEKIIALSTIRGAVCLVSLKPTSKLIAVSSEHINEQINCLCWNDTSSEVYIGDWNGKISVMVLPTFKVNGMFQTSSCTLMDLDSAIVQLSFSSSLLLASTLTRCYICDTVQEHYKLVGNKARYGEFGACFYKTYHSEGNSTPVAQKEEKLVNRKHFNFNLIPEGNSNVQEENFPQIFCARPGFRLWEVSANGVVMKTHQFKEALAVPPVTICKLNLKKSTCQKQMEQTWIPQSANFSRLFVIAKKYLFSYTSRGLYVLDPVTATVVLWNNEFSNITMADTVENRIYLMTTDGEFHCLTLSFLDSLILRLYNRKKYYECLEICLMHKVQLRKLINSLEIGKVCDVENKFQILRDDELSTLLHPLTNLLESNSKASPKKLDSGIVVVNSGNSVLNEEETFRLKSASHCTKKNRESELKEETDKINKSEDTNCNTAHEEEDNVEKVSEESKEELDPNRSAMQKIQADLEVVYALIGNIRHSMSEGELESIILDVDWRMNVIKDFYESLTDLKSFLYEILRSAELYYFNTLLENVSMQLLQYTDNTHIIKQIMKAFVNVNVQNCKRCTCGNPYSINELAEPKFLGIGRSLLKKFVNENQEQCINLCNSVPYMWREYLPVSVEQNDVLMSDSLRQCLQIRDIIVLSMLLPSLDGKLWNLLAVYTKQTQEGLCLFCGKYIKYGNNETSEMIEWSAVIHEIMKKQGPDFAMTLLVKLEKTIPNVSIDKSVFQSLIFTKILHQHGMKRTINFNKNSLDSSEYNTMCSAKVRDELVDVLEKDLGRSVSNNIFGSGAHHWGMQYQNKLSTCPCCTLSLQTPVLLGNNGIAIFGCGHAYHVNCMIEKKLTTCNLHS
ncbi:WD40 repeat domain-containing protein pink [Megalopta genalis]|uniref:WD40 repeat domain-containing protein pink n=1 Tax=Megalopta genalis TaxID=115081 RepID=UPI003FCFB53F